jgi:hypothetical protein
MKKKISRQRKWQIKKMNEGKCIICGKKIVVKCYCQKHRIQNNILRLKSYYKNKKI